MDEASPTELRAHLVFLFRALKVDSVFTFNAWGHSEENPDHYITAQAVEATRWMAGMDKDYPEQIACGIMPHTVKEQYYWVTRRGQPYNRVVNISNHIEKKVASMSTNKSQGPAGSQGSRLRAKLTEQTLRLPELGDDDETADHQPIKLFGLKENRKLGQKYGLEFAEGFHDVGPGGAFTDCVESNDVESYIAKNAVPL